jgi:hydroxyacylglutathione hydrolase
MKNSKVLPAVVIIVALLVIVVVYLANGFVSEFKKMKPLPTGTVAPGIVAIDNQMVNFYILKSDKGLVAIDSGAKTNLTLQEMKKAGFDPKRVIAVYLTHTDFDHTAGIALFPNAKIFISRPEESVINGKTPRSPLFTNKLARSYGFMEDGQVTNIAGFTVQAILTPGHTLGSFCYLVNGKYLFTGDTFSLRNGSVITFPNFINMDTELEKLSIKKLAALKGVEKVFTAHSGSTEDLEKAFKNWK